jgi:hypothetical protein
MRLPPSHLPWTRLHAKQTSSPRLHLPQSRTPTALLSSSRIPFRLPTHPLYPCCEVIPLCCSRSAQSGRLDCAPPLCTTIHHLKHYFTQLHPSIFVLATDWPLSTMATLVSSGSPRAKRGAVSGVNVLEKQRTPDRVSSAQMTFGSFTSCLLRNLEQLRY